MCGHIAARECFRRPSEHSACVTEPQVPSLKFRWEQFRISVSNLFPSWVSLRLRESSIYPKFLRKFRAKPFLWMKNPTWPMFALHMKSSGVDYIHHKSHPPSKVLVFVWLYLLANIQFFSIFSINFLEFWTVRAETSLIPMKIAMKSPILPLHELPIFDAFFRSRPSGWTQVATVTWMPRNLSKDACASKALRGPLMCPCWCRSTNVPGMRRWWVMVFFGAWNRENSEL